MSGEISSNVQSSTLEYYDRRIDENNEDIESMQEANEQNKIQASACLELSKKIRRKQCSLMSEWGVSNIFQMNSQQRKIFKGLCSDYTEARFGYIAADNRFLSGNLSIFSRILENGKLKSQRCLFE